MDNRIHIDVFQQPNNQVGVATKYIGLVAVELAKKYGVKLPKQKNLSNRLNLLNDIWKRDVRVDFNSDTIILKCILFNLSNYRILADTDENNSFTSYYKLLDTPYVNLFEEEYLQLIWKTLERWNMNARGAKLQKIEVFSKSLKNSKLYLDKLHKFRLVDFCDGGKRNEIEEILIKLFDCLDLTQSKNHFVTNAKTLHFLLPQLFIPMDRTYTVNYFTDYKGYDIPKDINTQVKWLVSMHKKLAELYKIKIELYNKLSDEVNLPITKLLDNTLIGFAMYREVYVRKFSPYKHI